MQKNTEDMLSNVGKFKNKRGKKMEIFTYLASLNWQTIIGIFAVNWYFYNDLKNKISTLEERMFYLATGKTLAQAIIDEKKEK